MGNREKVIASLKNCLDTPKCRDCPWELCEEPHSTAEFPEDLVRSALTLLENGDRKEAKIVTVLGGAILIVCPECRLPVTWGQRYCSHCGTGLIWHD